uniref:Uncharacterized protein n=1 Tax=Cacopsylla melanoneura TaxID=428564 RepID=A0A8D8Z9U4_9HEMI
MFIVVQYCFSSHCIVYLNFHFVCLPNILILVEHGFSSHCIVYLNVHFVCLYMFIVVQHCFSSQCIVYLNFYFVCLPTFLLNMVFPPTVSCTSIFILFAYLHSHSC